MSQVILTFCVACGVLQPEGKGTEPVPKCENCDQDLTDKACRIEGLFEQLDAEHLIEATFSCD